MSRRDRRRAADAAARRGSSSRRTPTRSPRCGCARARPAGSRSDVSVNARTRSVTQAPAELPDGPAARGLSRRRRAHRLHRRPRARPARRSTPTPILASAETVYASASSLYVATQRCDDGRTGRGDLDPPLRHRPTPAGPRTARAASVPGSCSTSSRSPRTSGVLRAATHARAPATTRRACVTTLAAATAGSSCGAAPSAASARGERIYAVRFLGDTGYVVTFRQTDPLYTLDLADPARPVVRGELKIPGYSAYLHPVGDGLLLGVGQDATRGRATVTGLQLSLFDVSDLAQPGAARSRSSSASRFSSSEVEWDHHAFLWWPRDEARRCCRSTARTSAARPGSPSTAPAGSRRSGRSPTRRAAATPARRRSGARSWSATGCSRSPSCGAKASALAGLADAGWAAFPERRAGPPDGPMRPRRALDPLAQHPEDAAHDLRAAAPCPGASGGSRRSRRRRRPSAPARALRLGRAARERDVLHRRVDRVAAAGAAGGASRPARISRALCASVARAVLRPQRRRLRRGLESSDGSMRDDGREHPRVHDRRRHALLRQQRDRRLADADRGQQRLDVVEVRARVGRHRRAELLRVARA